MLKIVHCLTDDKFAYKTIKIFEFLKHSCTCRYVFIQNNKNRLFKHIKGIDEITHLSTKDFLPFLKSEKCDVVILHNIESLPFYLTTCIPKIIKVVWFAWGYDIYNSLGSKPLVKLPNIYHKETLKLIEPNHTESWIKEPKKKLRLWIRGILIKKVVARVDYFSGVIPEEFSFMKEIPFFHAKQIDFRYADPQGGIDFSLLDTEEPVTGMNIMIGNSADPSNNHADIFMKLKDIDIEGRKIIVPLSYSGTTNYKKRIKELGYSLFGDKILFIEDFLPIDDYKKLVSSCGFRIFGHERQQAMGNIRMSLRLGCKVFISDTSIIYKYLTKDGLKLYSIQDDLNENGLAEMPSEGEIYDNRKKAIEHSLTTKQVERLHQLLTVLESGV